MARTPKVAPRDKPPVEMEQRADDRFQARRRTLQQAFSLTDESGGSGLLSTAAEHCIKAGSFLFRIVLIYKLGVASRDQRGRSVKKFSDLTEQEVLALAITNEEEDSRIYRGFAEGLREQFPSSAKVFDEMADEEVTHRTMLFDLYRRNSATICR